jgi:Secretion system C-terminal sorting domain
MKTKLSISMILLFTVVSTLTSQSTWFEKDATWYYKFYSYWEGSGYEKIVHVSDTLIKGKLCKKLLRDVYFVSVQTKTIEHKNKRAQFVYQSGDTIWQYKNNTFKQLYNFNLQIGDTVPFMNFHTVQNNKNVVSDIQTITIQGESLRQQTIDVFENNNILTKINIIEKIGVTSSPFSFFWNEFLINVFDIPTHKFRCYSDHATSSINYSNDVCDALPVTVDTDESDMANNLSLYPNPCSDKIYIKNLHSEVSYKVYTIHGTEMMSGMTKGEIDVNGLQDGLYLLKIKNQTPKKIIKE